MSDKLLDNVNYVSRKPAKMKNLSGEEIDVRDTFPFNPESKTAPDTAARWAKGYSSWYYDRVKDEKDIFEPVVEPRSNTPFNVRILSLEVRSEGGRAYKVVDDENRRFDLREDQLLEALRYAGIKPGGAIDGQFVWGISGSQVKMVFVGGKLHKEMTNYAELVKTQKALSLTQLKPGNIYAKREKNDLMLYVGRVTHPDLDGSHHAFIEVDHPSAREYDYERIDNKRVPRPLPEDLNIYQTTMARREAQKYTWPQNLILTKSPKFYEEIEEINDVNEITQNCARYEIQNGNGESLPEKFHAQKFGARQRIDGWSYSYRNNYEAEKTARENAIEDTKLKFISKLVWK